MPTQLTLEQRIKQREKTNKAAELVLLDNTAALYTIIMSLSLLALKTTTRQLNSGKHSEHHAFLLFGILTSFSSIIIFSLITQKQLTKITESLLYFISETYESAHDLCLKGIDEGTDSETINKANNFKNLWNFKSFFLLTFVYNAISITFIKFPLFLPLVGTIGIKVFNYFNRSTPNQIKLDQGQLITQLNTALQGWESETISNTPVLKLTASLDENKIEKLSELLKQHGFAVMQKRPQLVVIANRLLEDSEIQNIKNALNTSPSAANSPSSIFNRQTHIPDPNQDHTSAFQV